MRRGGSIFFGDHLSSQGRLTVLLLRLLSLRPPQMVPTLTPLFTVSPKQLARDVPGKSFLGLSFSPSQLTRMVK